MGLKYQLVIQLPLVDADAKRFDSILALEARIAEVLAEASEGIVDGNDFGSGEMNIFIHTNSPQAAFDALRGVLKDDQTLHDFRVGFREIGQDEYNPLWPPKLERFKVV